MFLLPGFCDFAVNGSCRLRLSSGLCNIGHFSSRLENKMS